MGDAHGDAKGQGPGLPVGLFCQWKTLRRGRKRHYGSRHLKILAGILNYPTRKGIPVDWFDTHSL